MATKAFKDFNNILEEAGSEKREHLLPGMSDNQLNFFCWHLTYRILKIHLGELEFSDQDNFDLNGPKEIRVPPPEGFSDDLKFIGSKFNEDHQEEAFVQSSIEPTSTKITPGTSSQTALTPPLQQFNPLASFTPEQVLTIYHL